MILAGSTMEFNTSPFSPGQVALGGIIAYILQPGDPGYQVGEQHGLVISQFGPVADVGGNDFDNWSPASSYVTGLSSTLGQGYNNTNQIITQTVNSIIYPAGYCWNLTENGYSDWFLPNYAEMYKVWTNRSLLGVWNTTTPPIAEGYWGSSQFNDTGIPAPDPNGNVTNLRWTNGISFSYAKRLSCPLGCDRPWVMPMRYF
jgi:hypothetical protein